MASSPPALNTPLCKLLGIKYPIMLAGMARTSGGPLAAAVTNAGGIGTIGGLGYTPKQLQEVSHARPPLRTCLHAAETVD